MGPSLSENERFKLKHPLTSDDPLINLPSISLTNASKAPKNYCFRLLACKNNR